MFKRNIVLTKERGRDHLEMRLNNVHQRDPKELILPMDTIFLSRLSGTTQTSKDTWFFDSGASHHKIGYLELLSDMAKRGSYQNVILGDNSRYVVRGVGATSFELKLGKTFKMKDVLHVMGMTSNLVSV